MTVWTQAHIDDLAAAIASGVLEVEYRGPPGRRVEYQSLPQMRALLAEMVAQVAGTARKARRYAAHRKGC